MSDNPLAAALRALRKQSLRKARREEPSLTIAIGVQPEEAQEDEDESEETAVKARAQRSRR